MLGERLTWRSITNTDVAKAPFNLSDGICSPIHRDDLHLFSRKSLGNSVGAASIVVGFEIPMALFIPESIEAGRLRRAPVVGRSNQ